MKSPKLDLYLEKRKEFADKESIPESDVPFFAPLEESQKPIGNEEKNLEHAAMRKGRNKTKETAKFENDWLEEIRLELGEEKMLEKKKAMGIGKGAKDPSKSQTPSSQATSRSGRKGKSKKNKDKPDQDEERSKDSESSKERSRSKKKGKSRTRDRSSRERVPDEPTTSKDTSGKLKNKSRKKH